MTVDIRDLLDVTFEVPDWIREGLNTGSLFREGGVVRKDTGEIAMFLRESSGLSQKLAKGNLPSSPLLSSQISSLRSLSTAALGMQVLNLGVSAIGFAVVISKLNKIQADLQAIHEKLDWVLEEVQWISQKQDLEMVGKMKAALEIANGAVLSSFPERRRQDIADASRRLLESAEVSKRFLDDLIKTKKYLSKPELLGLYYRTWTCSRIAHVQCELLLNENNLAAHSIQRMRQENEEIRGAYLHPLHHIGENLIPRIFMLEETYRRLKEIKELIPNTTSQIAGYQQEIDFVQRNGLSWEEWTDAGDSEEPKLLFLLPKNGDRI